MENNLPNTTNIVTATIPPTNPSNLKRPLAPSSTSNSDNYMENTQQEHAEIQPTKASKKREDTFIKPKAKKNEKKLPQMNLAWHRKKSTLGESTDSS